MNRIFIPVFIFVFGCSPSKKIDGKLPEPIKTPLDASSISVIDASGVKANVLEKSQTNIIDPMDCRDKPIPVKLEPPAQEPYTCKSVHSPCQIAQSLQQSAALPATEIVVLLKEAVSYREDKKYLEIKNRAKDKGFDLLEVLPDGNLRRLVSGKSVSYYCCEVKDGVLQIRLAMRKAIN
ncbi:MAG: hypothetical protein KBG15_08490 [Kofleriaceae bacterium]|nr:hypothetical protein [Kofleriaceae bacterium]